MTTTSLPSSNHLIFVLPVSHTLQNYVLLVPHPHQLPPRKTPSNGLQPPVDKHRSPNPSTDKGRNRPAETQAQSYQRVLRHSRQQGEHPSSPFCTRRSPCPSYSSNKNGDHFIDPHLIPKDPLHVGLDDARRSSYASKNGEELRFYHATVRCVKPIHTAIHHCLIFPLPPTSNHRPSYIPPISLQIPPSHLAPFPPPTE